MVIYLNGLFIKTNTTFSGGYFMRRFFSIIGCLLLLTVLIKGNATAENDSIVAKIGDKKITLADFNKIIGYADPEKQKMIHGNPQLKESILKQYVQSIVLSDLARKEDFDKRPEIKDPLSFYSDTYIANEFVKKEITGEIALSDEEKIKYYDSHLEEFKVPDTVRARHILVRVDNKSAEDDRKKAKQKAEDILRRIADGEDFAKVAAEISDDPSTKANGGDLGFFPRGKMVKSFEDAAFSLNPGAVSSVVETQYGYHIIKTEEKKAAHTESYDNVKGRIHQKLLQDKSKSKISEFIDKSLKDAGVEIYPEVFTGVKK
jgi:peptidyl-prolyl cis-trans isomerase C